MCLKCKFVTSNVNYKTVHINTNQLFSNRNAKYIILLTEIKISTNYIGTNAIIITQTVKINYYFDLNMFYHTYTSTLKFNNV